MPRVVPAVSATRTTPAARTSVAEAYPQTRLDRLVDFASFNSPPPPPPRPPPLLGELFCFVGCLTSQQHASISHGRICTDNFTCCHAEIEVADQTFYLTQSQYTDTGPTSPSADPIMPGAWQGSHWSANI